MGLKSSLRDIFNMVRGRAKPIALSLGLGLSTMFSGCSTLNGKPGDDNPGEALRNGKAIPEVVNIKGSSYRAVAIPYIMRTGNIVNYQSAKDLNTQIDFSRNDAFTRGLKTIENNSRERIRENPALQDLLAKKSWTRAERVQWEKTVSAIVSEETDKIPGFDDYRTPNDKNGVIHIPVLNELSADIEAGSARLEFDCESMSVVEGIVLQKIDNQLGHNNEAGNYKKATTYYLTGGYVGLGSNDPSLGGHAFLTSLATGAIIEGTSDPDFAGSTPYKEALNSNYGLRQFLGGSPAVIWDSRNRDVDVYLPRKSEDDYKNIQASLADKINTLRTAGMSMNAK